MRLAATILIASLHLCASGYSQEKISLSEKNASLQTVLQDIQKQTSYNIWYEKSELPASPLITIVLKDATLTEALSQCCKNFNLDFSIAGGMVVIKTKVHSKDDPPGKFIIKGIVATEKGEPLPGAAIFIRGTHIGTQSDSKGQFELSSNTKEIEVEISYTGYQTKTIRLQEGQTLTIQMSISVNPLDQVQIIAYGTTTRRLDIGDIASVNAETISQQPVSNTLEALEGRAAGLQITQQTGVPGGAFNVLIRGQNSIANGNNPLYIIDGVQFTGNSISSSLLSGAIISGGNPLSSLNPADIESVVILKDADATSIYGSRGANGVILINTKMGKSGKTSVDLNMYGGTEKITRFMPLLNTQQYLTMRHEAFLNNGETPNPYVDYDLLSWDTTRYTDWQKTLYGSSASVVNVQGTISGGNQNTQFVLSGGYNRQTTVFSKDFSYQKGSGHVGINHSSKDQRFKVSFTALYNVENSFLPSLDNTSQAISLPPDTPEPYDSTGKLNWAGGTFNNPYALLLSTYTANTNNLLNNMVLSYELFPHFQIRLNSGYSFISMNEVQTNPFSSLNPAYYTEGYSYFSNQRLENWILEPQIEYRRVLTWGNLDVLVGSTFQQNKNSSQTLYASGFSSDELISDIGAASTISQQGVNQNTYRYEALFARVNYNWKEKYLLNFTARRDGSSRFGPENQFANFGSIAGGWIFSRENFFQKHMPALSFGKIRTSYGTTGNDQIGDYQYLDSWSPTFYNYQSLSGLQPTRLFNPNYGWEINKKWEAGLELGFLKDIIYFTASYYHNQSSNQLVGYPLPAITGFISIQQNLAATVQNTGWEFVLNTRNISGQHFTWTTNINLTIPNNKLVAYPGIENSPYADVYEVGKPLSILKAFQSTGVDSGTGLYTFTDVNKDGFISFPEDLVAEKSVRQQYYGGFNNSFQYKNWKADIFFQFVKQTGRNYRSANYATPGMLGNQPEWIMTRWQKPGDETSVQQFTQDYGSPAYGAFSNQIYSDLTVSDASFIRLKTVSISYQIPLATVNRWHLQELRFYLQGQNLLTFTHFMGIDPENQTLQALPPLTVITGGFQITL